jgi:hypothetical protein
MEYLSIPWLFMGPTSSGKLTTIRKWIERAHNTTITLPLEERKFTVGDGYEARVLASPYHFEIDIPNLSMQDKQIIGDLLTTFFSSGDVLNSLRTNTRKLVVLRRAHALSLPAAIRVRAIIQQFVLPPEAAGMLWITAREMTGSLSLLADAFVHQSVPRMSFTDWVAQPIPEPLKAFNAYDRCNGRLERVHEVLTFFPDGNIPKWPRRIQDYYDEMMMFLIAAARSGREPNLTTVLWIRARIYQALSLCQNSPDIIDSLAIAVQRSADQLEQPVFWKAMCSLAKSEPHTSYRTPLSLEAALLDLFEVIRIHSTPSSNGALSELGRLPAAAATPAAIAKAPAKRRGGKKAVE